MVCGKLELEILNSFWSLTEQDEDKDISIQDVVDYLSETGLDRAYTTIKTVMDRLTAKSILVRYKSGKKYFYKVTVDKSEMAYDAVKNIAEDFFNGDFAKLIRFIETELNEVVLR